MASAGSELVQEGDGGLLLRSAATGHAAGHAVPQAGSGHGVGHGGLLPGWQEASPHAVSYPRVSYLAARTSP